MKILQYFARDVEKLNRSSNECWFDSSATVLCVVVRLNQIRICRWCICLTLYNHTDCMSVGVDGNRSAVVVVTNECVRNMNPKCFQCQISSCRCFECESSQVWVSLTNWLLNPKHKYFSNIVYDQFLQNVVPLLFLQLCLCEHQIQYHENVVWISCTNGSEFVQRSIYHISSYFT